MSNEKREIVKILSRAAPFSSAVSSELETLAESASLRRYAAGASAPRRPGGRIRGTCAYCTAVAESDVTAVRAPDAGALAREAEGEYA